MCCFVIGFRVKCHTHGTAILILNFPYEWRQLGRLIASYVMETERYESGTITTFSWIFFSIFRINIQRGNEMNEMKFTKTSEMSLEKLYK